MERVRNTLDAIGRRIGKRSQKKVPLLAEHLRVLATLLAEGTLTDKRDLALLLVGFAAALRRGELVGLRVADVVIEEHGMSIHLGKRKTDQVGRGTTIAVTRAGGLACPVRALRQWMGDAGIKSGFIFPVMQRGRIRPGQQHMYPGNVGEIIRSRVKLLGLEPEGFGGHSLRRGLMTSAARAGRRLEELMGTSGHKSVSVAQGYIDNASPFEAAADRGLLGGVTEPAEPAARRPNLERKAKALYARGYSVEQIARFITKGAGREISPSMIAEWVR
jgi:integrase